MTENSGSKTTEIANRWEPYFMWGFENELIFMIDADGKEICIQEHPDLHKAIQDVCREWDAKRRKGCAAMSDRSKMTVQPSISQTMVNEGVKELRYYLDNPRTPMGQVVIAIYRAMEAARAR